MSVRSWGRKTWRANEAARSFWFLGLQVFAIIWAGAVFSIFESRLVAGAMAGSYFIGSGAWMFWRALKWPDKWTSLSWYPLTAHLFIIALPMVVTRFLNADQPFEAVKILGLEAPVFHKLSTWIFSGLVLGTLADLFRAGCERNPRFPGNRIKRNKYGP
ncbi:MAG: hypothetical protein HC902_08095 [Calothrix sp. SM1_5_4]|nr:hypothetical protein [Calothrix sp. SM1_5_4]